KQNVIYNTIKQSFMLLLNVLQPDNKKIKVAKEKIAEFYTSGYLSIIFSWLLTGIKETCEAITKELIIMTNQNLIYLLDSKGVS
ncbi:MAG: TetR-like C-terminal domain-containing protein, partial [Candidatus Thorarchaeota archaeon]